MTRKPKQASKSLENNDEKEISESQKRHYASMGYKPYLTENGKIKWQNYEQHVYEKIKYAKKSGLLSLRSIFKRLRMVKILRHIRRIIFRNYLIFVFFMVVILMLIYNKALMNLLGKL